jgi:hypothetical protein
MFSCECEWVKDYFRGHERCIRCGNQRDITHNSTPLRTNPVCATSGDGLNRWIHHSASPGTPNHRDHSSDVHELIDRYVMDENVVNALGSQWNAFLKEANITPKRERRRACAAVIILCNRSIWKGHDEVEHIRAEISTSALYRAFKYIRELESVDIAKYAPDLETFRLEELDWSSC